MQSFFHGLKSGNRFARLEDANDLGQILGMLTRPKISQHVRLAEAQKRGGEEVRGESVFTSGQCKEHAPGLV